MFHVSTLARFTLVIGFILNTPAVAQEAFLNQGTTALNPNNKQTLFLYVPGHTLLYHLGEIEEIRRKRDKKKEKYQHAKTQDGIDVLLRKADIREDISVLIKNSHFLVHRRMPFCHTRDTCSTICDHTWRHFSTDRDEGKNWEAIWRATGRFEAFADSKNRGLCAFLDDDSPKVPISLKVRASFNSKENEGCIPRKFIWKTRNGEIGNELKLEEAGFITLLNCHQYPAYSFEENAVADLTSPCNKKRSQKTIKSLWKAIENYTTSSIDAELGIHVELGKLLSFLGFGAGVKAKFEEIKKIGQGNNDEEMEIISTDYGKVDEEWQVKFVEIRRPPYDNSENSLFSKAIVKKVFKCQAGGPTEMTFASFFVPMDEGNPITINLDKKIIEEELSLPSGNVNGGLVSINNQSHHYKLLDYLLEKRIPKGVANFFIKEINVAKARR